MAQITAYNKIINGTRGDATKLNFNFTAIEDKYNAHDTATTEVHDIGAETIAGQVGLKTLIDRFNPVSTVIHIWRPTGVTCDSIDSDIYLPLNGGTVDDEDSLYDEVVLPDMNNKYLIGVETSGTIDATPIGNSGHTIDFSHYHTETSAHKHSSYNHNHTTLTHNHSMGGYCNFYTDVYVVSEEEARITIKTKRDLVNLYEARSYSGYLDNIQTGSYDTGSGLVPLIDGYTYSVSGTSSNTDPTDGVSSNDDTTSTGSTTFDIQPKSLQVQMYIRYK